LRDYIRLKLTEVLDTDGDLELEVNTLRPQVVVEQQSVWKERKSEDDNSMPIILLSYTINIQIAPLINTKWTIVSISKKNNMAYIKSLSTIPKIMAIKSMFK
jgi:hypothetical protein